MDYFKKIFDYMLIYLTSLQRSDQIYFQDKYVCGMYRKTTCTNIFSKCCIEQSINFLFFSNILWSKNSQLAIAVYIYIQTQSKFFLSDCTLLIIFDMKHFLFIPQSKISNLKSTPSHMTIRQFRNLFISYKFCMLWKWSQK